MQGDFENAHLPGFFVALRVLCALAVKFPSRKTLSLSHLGLGSCEVSRRQKIRKLLSGDSHVWRFSIRNGRRSQNAASETLAESAQCDRAVEAVECLCLRIVGESWRLAVTSKVSSEMLIGDGGRFWSRPTSSRQTQQEA